MFLYLDLLSSVRNSAVPSDVTKLDTVLKRSVTETENHGVWRGLVMISMHV
jgi:hypothetical protein